MPNPSDDVETSVRPSAGVAAVFDRLQCPPDQRERDRLRDANGRRILRLPLSSTVHASTATAAAPSPSDSSTSIHSSSSVTTDSSVTVPPAQQRTPGSARESSTDLSMRHDGSSPALSAPIKDDDMDEVIEHTTSIVVASPETRASALIESRPAEKTLPPLAASWHLPSTRPNPSYFSSFLRPGSRFLGTQESDKQIYNVEVNIKHVDLVESSLCGYLRIEGLARDHPSLTTYFEGEMIGCKYNFVTRNKAWGATEKTDMQHWDRFPAWRPLAKQARKSDFHMKNWTQREHVFMRWKEVFLVPDHRVREISGASFEGFYYICFNQATGQISGIYFHARSEKYQQLELKPAQRPACFPAINFC